jgi:hypothetical protein
VYQANKRLEALNTKQPQSEPNIIKITDANYCNGKPKATRCSGNYLPYQNAPMPSASTSFISDNLMSLFTFISSYVTSNTSSPSP